MFEMFSESVVLSTISMLLTTADNLVTCTIQINSWMRNSAIEMWFFFFLKWQWEWGKSNYNYTCNISNPNCRLNTYTWFANDLTRKNAIILYVNQFPVDHIYSFACLLFALPPLFCVPSYIFVAFILRLSACNKMTTGNIYTDNDIHSCSHPYLILWLEIQLIVIAISFYYI